MATQSAQSFVPIKEIKNGVVILKDGSLRMVLVTSSQNLALKSEDEQRAVLQQFQNFLNSLDFSVQIFTQSRRLDIGPYLALLEERHKEQPSDLMKIQTREYINFVKKFTDSVSIMTKSFFVIIPYSPTLVKTASGGPLGKIFPKAGGAEKATIKEAFEEQRSQIEQRVSTVEQGLTRSGLRVAPLGTEELVELYYKMFNPGEIDKPAQLEQ